LMEAGSERFERSAALERLERLEHDFLTIAYCLVPNAYSRCQTYPGRNGDWRAASFSVFQVPVRV